MRSYFDEYLESAIGVKFSIRLSAQKPAKGKWGRQ
jgi:hypothetical protein